jgi:hypothetical protein
MENFGDLLEMMLDNTSGSPNFFDSLLGNPEISFGPIETPYVMASIFPERTVESEDVIRDNAMRFHSIIANATDRFSPPQYKSAVEAVNIGARLADSNAGFKLEAAEVEQITRILRTGNTLRAFEQGTVKPLLDLAELWRVQCAVYARVNAVGMNGRNEQIDYENPTGARSAVAGAWSDGTYDPMPDIQAKVTWLASNGYRVNRIVVDQETVTILAGNAKMIARAAALRIVQTSNVNGTTVSGLALSSRMSITQLNSVLADAGLPALEVYEGVYNTTTQRGVKFWPRRTMAFFGVTAQGEDIVDQSGVLLRTLTNTVGFTALGIVVAQVRAGRVYQNKFEDMLPPSAIFTGWQTLIPVLEQFDAIAVLSGIH